jgi:tRNA-dihydrouridine synthase A
MLTPKNRLINVAPMLDWTDQHCRYFMRLIAPTALLYSEMITTGAILYGNSRSVLDFDPLEHPVALQLGGSDPDALATCAQIGADYGYDEINLNVGCPSSRVQSARFGACLMAEPDLVADCVRAMKANVSIPVTVKTRIGIDEHDSYDYLAHFVKTVAGGGCQTFIIHARKAWLSGLSPKENRDIPPLCYERVYQLKQDFPDLTWILNGGLTTLEQIITALPHVDGVMIGREAYQNPYFLAAVEQQIFPDAAPLLSRHEVFSHYLPYASQRLAEGVPLGRLMRPLLGLFHGLPRSRSWRRYLSTHAHLPGAGIEVLKLAFAQFG